MRQIDDYVILAKDGVIPSFLFVPPLAFKMSSKKYSKETIFKCNDKITMCFLHSFNHHNDLSFYNF